MLKRNDVVVVIGGCQSCGCKGIVVDVTKEKVKLKFEERPTSSSCTEMWFRIQNVQLVPNGSIESRRELYKFYFCCDNETVMVKLTPDQANLMKYLSNCGVFDDVLEYEHCSEIKVVTP